MFEQGTRFTVMIEIPLKQFLLSYVIQTYTYNSGTVTLKCLHLVLNFNRYCTRMSTVYYDKDSVVTTQQPYPITVHSLLVSLGAGLRVRFHSRTYLIQIPADSWTRSQTWSSQWTLRWILPQSFQSLWPFLTSGLKHK